MMVEGLLACYVQGKQAGFGLRRRERAAPCDVRPSAACAEVALVAASVGIDTNYNAGGAAAPEVRSHL